MAKQEPTKTPIEVTTPLSDEDVRSLLAGQPVLISGVLYTARDAAHRRMVEALERGDDLPFDIRGQVIYYVGPTPAPPGRVIGAAGPTTAGRMDRYTPALLARGLKGAIGKGSRSDEVKQSLKTHTAVYFGGLGGAGALLARSIQTVEIVACLVGSEMCIRDSSQDTHRRLLRRPRRCRRAAGALHPDRRDPVSYTHLTLPTILLV